MKALFDGIKLLFDTSCEGELYNTEAPANAEFPFTVMQLVSGVTDDFASNKAFTENLLIQFNLFDKSPLMDDLLRVYTALIAAFDFVDLTVAGTTHLSCVRENVLSTRVDGVWQINVTYRIKLRA